MPHHPPTHLQQLVRSSDVARRMKAELNQASPQLVGGDRLVVVGVHGTEQLDFTARNDNTRDCTTSHGQNTLLLTCLSAMGLYAIRWPLPSRHNRLITLNCASLRVILDVVNGVTTSSNCEARDARDPQYTSSSSSPARTPVKPVEISNALRASGMLTQANHEELAG
jgi:hypothetical protein